MCDWRLTVDERGEGLDNNIGTEGGKAIADALKSNSCLAWIDLSRE